MGTSLVRYMVLSLGIVACSTRCQTAPVVLLFCTVVICCFLHFTVLFACMSCQLNVMAFVKSHLSAILLDFSQIKLLML